MLDLKDFVVVTGHYGCGKTNFSINLALDYAARGRKVTIVDMDLVNPYFRTSDYREMLESKGIEVIAPVFGHTNLDIPSLPAAMYSIFDSKDMVIVDVGGDDVGSTVLGRFRPKFEGLDYDMLYVVNRFRNLTATPEDAVEILNEIKAVSGLNPTGLINNSHLMAETDEHVIAEGIEFAERISSLTGLELKANTLRRDLFDAGLEKKFPGVVFCPVDLYVKVCW
ncbi:MAG: tyrosine-protein kinase family protein [Lachnospiraceae bacterium]|nr:tyrosine-protein kinase family protein [Lachnospiraceae bacterium]